MVSTVRVLLIATFALPLTGCTKSQAPAPSTAGAEAEVSPAEAKAIAEEAYVYAYPMLENYRTMYVQAIDKNSGGYLGAFNKFEHSSELLGPDFNEIVRPNNDTLYSFAWLDVRAQPIIITVPQVEARYYSVQLVDMFTQNIAYIGTRSTGDGPGSYLVAGPQWQGAKPGSVAEVIQSDSEFIYCIVRIEVRGAKDIPAVTKLQEQLRLTPMYQFLGRSRIPVATGITFPRYDARKVASAGFVDYLNLLLTQVRIPKSEGAMMERFAKIGIRPGMLSASLQFSAATREAVDAGVGAALVKISKVAQDLSTLEGVEGRAAEGWVGVVGMFGSPKEMAGRYLVRAAAAMMGLYGNDAEEAYYPVANLAANGDPLNAADYRYVLHFAADELPPVDAFWSLTMYGLPDQLMVSNPINRYSVGDRSKLRRDQDGSVTVYIQQESPGKKNESNWLPAPNGPFSLQLRMYLPKPGALEAPIYLPPGIEVAR